MLRASQNKAPRCKFGAYSKYALYLPHTLCTSNWLQILRGLIQFPNTWGTTFIGLVDLQIVFQYNEPYRTTPALIRTYIRQHTNNNIIYQLYTLYWYVLTTNFCSVHTNTSWDYLQRVHNISRDVHPIKHLPSLH